MNLRAIAVVALAATHLTVVGSGPASATLEPPPVRPIAGVPAPELVPDGIDAVSFVLVDARTGQVLLSRAADERRPIASTIKVLTALTVAERLPAERMVEVGDEVLGVGGSEVGLAPGDRWSVEDLLEGLLVRSGNEAAEALALATSADRAAFIDAMRSDARAIGLGDVTITSPSGLDDGSLLSALELVVLARVALAHPVLAPIVARSNVVLPGVGEVENRNLLVGSYPGATGVKTGFTSAAGNVIVASARRGERELVVAILGSGPDPARFRDAARLLDVGFDAFDDVEPSIEVTYASGAGWWSGSPVTSPSFLLPAGRTAETVVDLPTLLGGPVPDARVTVDGQDVVRVALVAQPPPAASGGPRRGASSSARLAEGVADGVYGALRAAIAAGALG